MRLFRIILRLFFAPRRRTRRTAPPFAAQLPREMRTGVVWPATPAPPPETELRGPCWVIDGDTIIIDKIRIRIAGIDAPELDTPSAGSPNGRW